LRQDGAPKLSGFESLARHTALIMIGEPQHTVYGIQY